MRKKILLLISAGFVILLVFIAYSVEVCIKEVYMCSVCGSTKEQTVWRYGYTTSKTHQASPLELWLTDHKKEHAHQWVRIVGDGQNIFGIRMITQHSRAPAIYYLSRSLDDLVKTSSEKEIDEFVQSMTNGSEEEKAKKAEEISNSILDSK